MIYSNLLLFNTFCFLIYSFKFNIITRLDSFGPRVQ